MEQIRSHAGLRGIAALLVVAYHLQLDAPDLPSAALTRLLHSGYLMVDLFFVLSGFIIAYVNRADTGPAMTTASARDFFLKRAIRLYPLHLVTLAGFVALTLALDATYAAMGRSESLWWARWDGTLAVQALLLNAWLPNPSNWNVPSWSISAELTAYALFPLVMAANLRARGMAQAGMLLLSAAFYGWIATGTGSLDVIGGGIAPLRCLAGFLLGMLIFYNRALTRRVPSALLAAVQAATVVAILLLMCARDNDVWLVPAFCLLVATSWEDRGPLLAPLATRPMQALGDWSYSVYLTHVPVIAVTNLGWGMIQARAGLPALTAQLLYYALTVAIVVGLSALTYRLIEAPARRALTRQLLGRRATPMDRSPPAP